MVDTCESPTKVGIIIDHFKEFTEKNNKQESGCDFDFDEWVALYCFLPHFPLDWLLSLGFDRAGQCLRGLGEYNWCRSDGLRLRNIVIYIPWVPSLRLPSRRLPHLLWPVHSPLHWYSPSSCRGRLRLLHRGDWARHRFQVSIAPHRSHLSQTSSYTTQFLVADLLTLQHAPRSQRSRRSQQHEGQVRRCCHRQRLPIRWRSVGWLLCWLAIPFCMRSLTFKPVPHSFCQPG